jgi:hypothetical protein
LAPIATSTRASGIESNINYPLIEDSCILPKAVLSCQQFPQSSHKSNLFKAKIEDMTKTMSKGKMDLASNHTPLRSAGHGVLNNMPESPVIDDNYNNKSTIVVSKQTATPLGKQQNKTAKRNASGSSC